MVRHLVSGLEKAVGKQLSEDDGIKFVRKEGVLLSLYDGKLVGQEDEAVQFYTSWYKQTADYLDSRFELKYFPMFRRLKFELINFL